jgi:hypothetical protein
VPVEIGYGPGLENSNLKMVNFHSNVSSGRMDFTLDVQNRSSRAVSGVVAEIGSVDRAGYASAMKVANDWWLMKVQPLPVGGQRQFAGASVLQPERLSKLWIVLTFAEFDDGTRLGQEGVLSWLRDDLLTNYRQEVTVNPVGDRRYEGIATRASRFNKELVANCQEKLASR